MMRLIVETECETCDTKGHLVVQSSRGPLETDVIVCSGCNGDGVSRRVVGIAALTKAVDDAATEAGVHWSPNLGPIITAAVGLGGE